jgi:tRNA pseudouridine32 synthase/23S rRNA pseudouridine746 synthase
MAELAQEERFNREGKMYGVLLAQDATGQGQVLKAFSGLLNGASLVPGWVPPIPGRATVALQEAITLNQLEAIKQELLALQNISERSRLAHLTEQYQADLHQLAIAQQQRKQLRQQQRQDYAQTLTGEALDQAWAKLNQASQQDGRERRQLKAQHQAKLQPLHEIVTAADSRVRDLKQQRKQISRQLQEQLYAAYQLTNFAGQSAPLNQLMPNGLLPTGTGDCCAPKLLHYAAVQGWQPLAMAEFWWGPPAPQDDKIPGAFYGACRDRCQPLMGFLLGGIRRQEAEGRRQEVGKGRAGKEGEVRRLYEDDWIVVVEKPAGLLSVPGRTLERQDSVWSRLRGEMAAIRVVHRLDQDTSGILLLARDLETYQKLSQQFQQRQVFKRYEAILRGTVRSLEGVIELPLWGDPSDRPRQSVDWQRGKPSTTKYRVISRVEAGTRVEFLPITGRTHQLRVHAAHPQGLGAPIRGDRLYGPLASGGESCNPSTPGRKRLHLHAKELIVQHPHTGRSLHIQSTVPF